MCECSLIVAANISGGASPSLSLSFTLALSLILSQSADVVWPAGLPSLHLTVTNNKNTHWLANSSPVWLTVLLAGRLAKGPDILHNRCEHRHGSVYILHWLSAFTDVFTLVCWHIRPVRTRKNFGLHEDGQDGPWHDLRHDLRPDNYFF